MDLRLSDLENEEVDYLRFDRIKIQRKRMEHILEVIKDLTFKNKGLMKQNIKLKQEIQEERSSRKQYEENYTQQRLLIDKNILLSNELHKYRETAVHHEILISSLKEELHAQNYRSKYYRDHFYTQPHLNFETNSQTDKALISQEYQILKTQYEDLQDQYSKLFQAQYSKDKESSNLTGHIYSKKRGHSKHRSKAMLRKDWSSQTLEIEPKHQTVSISRLREKYQKLKKIRKDLAEEVKLMQSKISYYQLREENLIELVQMLKEIKGKICLCHINKLQKQFLTKINSHRAHVNSN